jgi:hypothetical protein
MERFQSDWRSEGPGTVPNIRLQDFKKGKLEHWLNEISRPEVRDIRLKIIRNLNYVSPDELDLQLKNLDYKNFPKKPYAVVFDHKVGKSKRWIYDKVKTSLPTAPEITLYPVSEMTGRNMSKIITKGISDFVCFDDAAYSASQIRLLFLHMILECAQTGVREPNFRFYIPFMTDAAKKMLNSLQESYIGGRVKPKVFIESQERILSMRDVLNAGDKKVMKRIHKSYGEYIYLNSSLTYFDHRRPDIQAFEFSLGEIMTKGAPPYKRAEYLKREADSYRSMLIGEDF